MFLAISGAGTLAAGSRLTFALRATLGLAIWAHALFFLALIGQLRPVPVMILALVSMIGLAKARWEAPMVVAGGVAAALFLLALHPPVAFDETLYHLPFVRAVAESGELRFLIDNRFPVFPRLQELLCVPPFLIAGDAATHLVSLIEIALTAALLFEWGRGRAGLVAAALFLGSPIVVHLATIGYVDPALALLVTAGFFCLDRQQYAISGFFLGTACGVKYLGGYFAVVALVAIVVMAANRRRAALIYSVCCAAAALPTTIWLVANTGNPVFPFLGSSPWSLALPAPGAQLVNTLRLPWDVTFARERMNAQPPFTPLFAAMLVVLVAAALRDRRARALAIIVAGYLVVFSFLPQDSRYLVSLLPLLSVTAATVVAARWPKAVPAIAVLAVAFGAAYAAYRLTTYGMPPATAAERRQALTRRIPEFAALERAVGGTTYVCGGEQLKYHASGTLLGDFNGPYSYDRVLRGDIAENLRRIDARWFLVARRACEAPVVNGGMDLVYEDRFAQLWRVQSSPQRR